VLTDHGRTGRADHDAVRRSYHSHGRALHSHVLRLVRGDRHRAEDVVQEVMLRYWTASAGLDEGAVRPWLFRAARNLVIDEYRKRRARPAEVPLPPDRDAPGAGVDEVAGVIDSMLLADALARLSEPHRQIIVRLYWQGEKGSEIARDLGIPPGTVRSRTHHALRALRRELS
jgi:RNA polymerase sigma-70 factor, ECF subfamily